MNALKSAMKTQLTLVTLIFIFTLVACGGGGSTTTETEPILSTPSVATLSFDIKTFRFSWPQVSDATHYKLLENPDGDSGYTQVGSDISLGSQSYDHRVALYQRINASYILQSCNANGCTDEATFFINDTLVEAIGYFKASNTDVEDYFGTALSLSADGKTLAVGLPNENSITERSGAVTVFAHTGNLWTEQAFIKASNPGTGDQFGVALSLSADGNTLAVGAGFEDSIAIGSGAVYVFTRAGNLWTEQTTIKASNPGVNDIFGIALSLSGNGNTLAVGAGLENGIANDSGAVYVFTHKLGLWTEQAYIKASNFGANDNFGFALSLNTNGNILAVGAAYEDSTAVNSGAVYVFTRELGLWSEQAFIKASNPGPNNYFGTALSLSSVGSTLAVGASLEGSTAIGSGAVYVFTRKIDSWIEHATIKASNPSQNDSFGTALSLSWNGYTLVVGAKLEDSNSTGVSSTSNVNNFANNSGAAYVYSRTANTWTEQAYIKASNPGVNDRFGSALSLSADGNTLAVGAPEESGDSTGIGKTPIDDGIADRSGAVYIY